MENKKMMSIEEARQFFADDRFATENGAVIDEIGDHCAKCSLTLDSRHKNAVGGVMGGVHFMLADFAFAVASNRDGERTVSLSSNITLLRACRGSRLIAEATRVKDGKTACYYTVNISDELGNLLAAATISGCHV